MAINFQLTRKGETEPKLLWAVDAELCWHFRAEHRESRWFADWYDLIGFKLALGDTWAEIRHKLRDFDSAYDWIWDNDIIDVVNWLEANYTVNSFSDWRQR